jgi:hypothetical protein
MWSELVDATSGSIGENLELPAIVVRQKRCGEKASIGEVVTGMRFGLAGVAVDPGSGESLIGPRSENFNNFIVDAREETVRF